MMAKKTLAAAVAAYVICGLSAANADVSDYTIKQLLEPCIEGDNDARWGAAAEAECEQYISGFADAYVLLTDDGKADKVCLPPAGNRADEIRWAFMRWAHENYGQRDRPAAEGLMAVIKSKFTCQ